MKVEMPRAKTIAIVGGQGLELRQLSVGELEHLQCAGIFAARFRCVVPPRDEYGSAIGRRGANLMGIDAGIRRRLLRDEVCNRAVGVEPAYGDIARLVIGDEQEA